MAAYITVGAKTTHGGTVISGSPHTTHNGIPVARKGDKVACKKCKKVVSIATGDPSVIVDGSPIARAGDVTTCGSKLIANQQAFAESGFDVSGIEQAAALVFPKVEAEDLAMSLAGSTDDNEPPEMGPDGLPILGSDDEPWHKKDTPSARFKSFWQETGEAIIEQSKDPINYIPGGILAKAPKIAKLGKAVNLTRAIEKERALAKAANWKKPDGSIWWPDNKKGYDKVPGSSTTYTYQKGQRFSRYSDNPPYEDTGSYVSPKGTTFGQRAMPGKESDYVEREFVILKDLPPANRSTVTPWFDQPGMGKQDQLPLPIKDLIDKGYIKYLE